MSTVYKRKQSPFYYSAFTDAKGNRTYRSTGTTDKDEAKEIAGRWGREAKEERAATKGEQRELGNIVVRVQQLANRGELTEARAREAIADLYRLSAGKQLESYTVREWLEYWKGLHSKTESKSATTGRERSVVHILKALGRTAEKRIDLITPDELEKVKTWLGKQLNKSGQPIRTRTQNDKLAHLKAAFTEAFNRGLITSNPALAVKLFKVTDSEIVGDFNELEIQKLLTASEGEWRGLIVLAAHTGLRRENLLRLKWSEVNLGKLLLSVVLVKRKDGSPAKVATIPMTPDVQKVLSQQQGKHDEFVFEDLHTLTGSDPNYRFNKIMKKAKVPRETTLEGGIKAKRTFHSLRHSFVSMLANAEISTEIRQELAGHADAAVHGIYSHMSENVLRAGINTLPDINSAA